MGKEGLGTGRASIVFVVFGYDGSSAASSDSATTGSGAGADRALTLLGPLVVTLEATILGTAETVRSTYSMSITLFDVRSFKVVADVSVERLSV